MKKVLLSTIATASLMLLLPLSALAGPQDFTIDNNTGFDIHQLYVSPTGVDSWQNDILGEDIMPNGSSDDIKFSDAATAKDWDLKMVDVNGNSYEWTNLDLLDITKVKLDYDGTNATAEIEAMSDTTPPADGTTPAPDPNAAPATDGTIPAPDATTPAQ